MTITNPRQRRRRTRRAATAAVLAATITLAACGGGNGSSTTATTDPGTSSTTAVTGTGGTTGSGGEVLPVTDNPITNTATAQTLTIDSVLVENNVDAAGKATDDHLEVALTNTGSADLSGFEVFYTFTDPTAGTAESYYVQLPADFTVPAGGSRVAHFDNTGATDHFAVNKFSLYATSINQLDVKVEVSAQGAAVQTATVQKDAGGAEVPD